MSGVVVREAVGDRWKVGGSVDRVEMKYTPIYSSAASDVYNRQPPGRRPLDAGVDVKMQVTDLSTLPPFPQLAY